MSVPYALYAKTAENAQQGPGPQRSGPQGIQEQGLQGDADLKVSKAFKENKAPGDKVHKGSEQEPSIQESKDHKAFRGIKDYKEFRENKDRKAFKESKDHKAFRGSRPTRHSRRSRSSGYSGDQGPQGIPGNDGLLPNGTAIGNTTFGMEQNGLLTIVIFSMQGQILV